MASKTVKGNKKGIIIASVIAAVIVTVLVIIGVSLMKENGPSNATLKGVSVNVLHELVLEMSDGSIVVAGSLPRNREGIRMESAQIETGIDELEKTGYRPVRIICVDDNGVDYEKKLNFPVFGEGHSLISARMNRDGCIIFNTTRGEENGGRILYPSIPNEIMTPNGASPLRPEGGAPYQTTAQLKITVRGYGYLTAAVDYHAAPETAAAFVALVENGYYDGKTFSKILKDHGRGYIMTDAVGAAGTQADSEFVVATIDNPVELQAGALALYRPDGASASQTQLLICTEDTAFTSGKYSFFGYVLSGMNIVREIQRLTVTFSEYEGIREEEIEKYRKKQAVIETIAVTRPVGTSQ